MKARSRAARRATFPLLLALVAGLVAYAAEPLAAAPGVFESDDFNAPSLDLARWSVVDPRGDGTLTTIGAGSGDAQLSMAVPGGVSHDPWTTNNSLRVVQAVDDAGFEVEAKFDSTPTARYQMHGLLAAQADGSFVRYGVHHTGTGLRLYAATVSPSAGTKRLDIAVAPGAAARLRLTRSGATWTLAYAAAAGSWTSAGSFTQSLQVASAGVFAGNSASSGAPPAYTALVDYAFNTAEPIDPEDDPGEPPPPDTTPPVITDVAVDPATTTATVTWTTDEPATSVVDYGPTTGYGATASDGAYTTSHTLALTGLAPGTTYQYSVGSTNLAALEASSPNASFTTDDEPAGTGFVSDDFSSGIDPSRWTEVDPVGDGTVTPNQPTACDSRAELGVPGGVAHDPWITNASLRALQTVTDGDLDLAAGFASVPSQRYQTQGLVLQQSASVYLRFSVHHDGTNLRLYGATFPGGGTATARVNKTVAAGAATALRVTRVGDAWTLAHSANGTSWTTDATFTFALDLSAAGVLAGNSASGGASPPAYSAVVDYVFDLASPIVPEDGGATCQSHPLTTNVSGQGSIARSPNAASYGPGTTVTLTATPASGWVFQGWSGAAGGSANPTTVTMTGPLTVTATFVEDEPPPPGEGPDIDVWHGSEQTFGALGQPQMWANVLGNVSDPDGVTSLSYTLNGGPSRPLSRGPDLRRLYGAGDFNVEIDYAELSSGANTVVITAVDGAGDSSTETVTVNRVAGTTWPLPYSTDWASATSISQRAQVADGKWALQGNDTIRAVEPGYDRTVAIGDLSWTDYVVTVPVTVHELSPGHGTGQSGGPLFGLGLRWRGHTAVGSEQPRRHWYPTGAFAWYRWESFVGYRLSGNDNAPAVQFANPQVQFGTTYIFKAQVTTLAGGSEYRFKVWASGMPEPSTWTRTIVDGDGPASGGVLLISHHVVADWGDVVVTPIAP